MSLLLLCFTVAVTLLLHSSVHTARANLHLLALYHHTLFCLALLCSVLQVTEKCV
jgi:hypothetical protein